jgi:phthiocerol/phenolphthiocerol synthesis type-I polyketide synthase E
VERQDDIRPSDIAVVGMACRFPGAPNLDTFWQNLREGRDACTRFGDADLLEAGIIPELLADPHYVKAGQILHDIDLFDADLFKITNDEAEILDPQHRLFLECAVEAFEHAGYDPESFQGGIGVYAGVGMNTYLLSNLADRYRTASSVERYRLMIGNDKDFLPTRVSFKLNLRGPSVCVNTACSTSLVAVHIACLSLMSGECDMALVGCAHVRVPQVEGYLFQEGLIFSPDGRCRAFDANARGTVLGSGVGVVVLRRLADARAARDSIHAVIKGSAINNDGGAKASYTAPSVEGQAAAISDAYLLAGCDPATISYIEAHGTGTPLGDPIELAALARAFASSTGQTHDCPIGSVKTNIGHLDVAAGMAGLIKTCLMLEHRWLVPSLHFERLNPEIQLTGTPFRVNTASTEWKATTTPRRAGVSSFGIGGTNAHVVLEEPAAPRPEPSPGVWQLLIVSARSPKALEKASDDLARCLKQHRDLDLGDVAYTLAMRKAYPYRLALTTRDHRDAALTLMLGSDERVSVGRAEGEPPHVAFLLHHAADDAKIAELCTQLPAFNRILGRLRGELGGRDPAFIAQYALVHLWISWHARPAAIVARDARSAADWLTAATAINPAVWGAVPPVLTDAQASAEHETSERIVVPLDFDPESVLRTLGRLWTRGGAINWASVYEESGRGRVPLPARPFDRRRHWIDAPQHVIRNVEARDGKLRHRLASADPSGAVPVAIAFIQAEIARILGTKHLPDADANVFDLGIDSLILIEVAAMITAELERTIAPSLFVDHFTIRAFATNLVSMCDRRPTATAAPSGHGGA